jgi:beta-galactosidase/beta-glucuronidase
MAGAFTRGRFDVTDKLVGGKNAIAVLIHPMPIVREPFDKRLDKVWTAESFNGNAPTFIVAAGWDWAPCCRDRNMGIWQRIYLSTTGDVSILDPYVITDLPLPNNSRADLTVKTELGNSSSQERKGTLRGKIGDASFAKPVTIAANETITVAIDRSSQPELSIENPKLWWPNGYGKQNLYEFAIRFETDDGKVSDQKTARVGIRKFTYRTQRPLTHDDLDEQSRLAVPHLQHL